MKKIFLILLLFSSLSFSENSISLYKDEGLKEAALDQLFKAIKTKNNIYAQALLSPKKQIKKNSYNVINDAEEKRTIIDVNWKNRKGYDPVTVAVIYNNLDMLKLLLKRGANLNTYSVFNRTILVLAIEYGSTKVAEYLIDNYKFLVNTACLDDGWTALQEAVLKENKKIVLKLLKNGAKIRQKDKNGYDVYDLATRHGKGLMVKMIRDYELGILK